MTDNGAREPEDGRLTAAEYVLGVLDADQRRAAELRVARDMVFAREVAFWEERLGGLANAVPSVAPPRNGWARIEAAIARAGEPAKERQGILAKPRLLARARHRRECARRSVSRSTHLCRGGLAAGGAVPGAARYRGG
ncbi:MAG: hypothetical protein ACXWVI_06665 [Methyloceanibacter sp.]